MRKTLKSIIAASAMLIGAQEASALACNGSIHVYLPSSWQSAFFHIDGSFVPFSAADESGWYTFDASELGSQSSEDFLIMEKEGGWNDAGITTKAYNILGGDNGWDPNDKFTCKDLEKTGELYIYENLENNGATAYSNTLPDAKYLYVLISPEMEEWMSSRIMISMDGGITGKALEVDPEKCGWFFYKWRGENVTDNVIFYRESDPSDKLGMNGDLEFSSQPTPIPLYMLFSVTDSLYFIPNEEYRLISSDDGWYTTYPEVDGVCEYNLAAIIYDTDASLHGAFTCKPNWASGEAGDNNACFYADAPYNVVSSASESIPCDGVTQGMVSSELDNTTKKPVLTEKGRKCFGSQADEAFAAMFNSTPNVNESYCVDLPFARSVDGKWTFDSDYYTSQGTSVSGGFYPAEVSPSADRMMSSRLPAAENKRKAEGPVFMCSGLRALDPKENVPYADLLCNGPSWNGGANCEGLFVGGSEFSGEFNGVEFSGDGWGWSCPNEAPEGWTFYSPNTEEPTGVMHENVLPMGESRWVSGASDSQVLASGGRNQHFCSESHGTFIYQRGQRFSFSGDDDVWVYIDNRLAVDLGGTHMTAPGYVNLDDFKGVSGALQEGSMYDLDIFFCDRRTTSSNIRIKTNMYIVQKSAVTVQKVVASKKGENEIEICYSKSSDGSCAAAMTGLDVAGLTCCGSEIESKCGATIDYVLVKGRNVTADAVRKDPYNVPGIDLSDRTAPKINKSGVRLPAGLWTLFAVIDGKYKKIETFRVTGNVNVLNGNAVALYFDGDGGEVERISYKAKNTALGGFKNPSVENMIPVYISAVVGDDDGLTVMQPMDAVGVEYSLNIPNGLQVFRKVDGALVEISSGTRLCVGESGVDTVYAYVSMAALDQPSTEYELKVAGYDTGIKLSFLRVQIQFVDSDGKAEAGSVAHDGYYDELWTGQTYAFNLVALKPLGNDTLVLCSDCNFDFELSAATSEGIELSSTNSLKFHNGSATVFIRSLKEYRYDGRAEGYAKIVVAVKDMKVEASYAPVYFRDTPTPYVVFADIFDKRGASSSLKITEPYGASEYLDGIADSVAVYYSRRIHKDSLPSMVCVLWDSAAADYINPVKMGYSNQVGDTLSRCNAVITSEIKCLNQDKSGYCDPKVVAGDLKLSAKIKTSGVGTVTSYTSFMDRGSLVKTGLVASIEDRIAPVPILAGVDSVSKGFEKLTVVVSEPVKLLDPYNKAPFDFILKASSELVGADMSSSANPVVSVDEAGQGKIEVVYAVKEGWSIPRAGDLIRLGGSMNNPMWSDGAFLEASSIRSVDEAYHWNSPTGYNEKVRLPSPWIEIKDKNDANFDDYINSGTYAEPTFRIKMVGPYKFVIVFGEAPVAGSFKTYSMYDVRGTMVKRGYAKSGETAIEAPGKGSYIIRSGHHSEIVKF